MTERVAEETIAHKVTRARARRLEALRQLADGVAHDLADVMQTVQSGVRLASARLGHDAATAQSILALVGDVAQRGGALTTRLLAFVTRGEIRPERIQVAPLLQRLGRLLANTSDIPLQIEIDAKPHLPPVLADPEELKAVLLSLVTAARSAMPEGGTLTLRAALDEIAMEARHSARVQPGSYIRISVTDTGIGQSRKVGHADIEIPHSTVELLGSGAQFELALLRDFAEQVGGGLACESTPGAGSTITLWVPVAEAADTMKCGPLEE
jgi:signal transduction histidine kinase